MSKRELVSTGVIAAVGSQLPRFVPELEMQIAEMTQTSVCYVRDPADPLRFMLQPRQALVQLTKPRRGLLALQAALNKTCEAFRSECESCGIGQIRLYYQRMTHLWSELRERASIKGELCMAYSSSAIVEKSLRLARCMQRPFLVECSQVGENKIGISVRLSGYGDEELTLVQRVVERHLGSRPDPLKVTVLNMASIVGSKAFEWPLTSGEISIEVAEPLDIVELDVLGQAARKPIFAAHFRISRRELHD